MGITSRRLSRHPGVGLGRECEKASAAEWPMLVRLVRFRSGLGLEIQESKKATKFAPSRYL